MKLHILIAILVHAVFPPLISAILLPVLGALIGKSRFPIHAFLPILYAYLYYIPIMAINGVTESFIASVATTQDLARQSRAMVVFSIVFLASSWGLLKALDMGGEGLVWANCINMGVRIVWSCQFIETWYTTRSEKFGWTHLLPSFGTAVSATGIGLLVRLFCSRGLNGFLDATCVGGVAALILLCCMYNSSLANLTSIEHILKGIFF
jgi:Rft protein